MNRKQKRHRPKGKSTSNLEPLHRALYESESIGNVYDELFHDGKVLTPTSKSFNKLVEEIKMFAIIDAIKREKIQSTLENLQTKVSKKEKLLYSDLNRELKELLELLNKH